MLDEEEEEVATSLLLVPSESVPVVLLRELLPFVSSLYDSNGKGN